MPFVAQVGGDLPQRTRETGGLVRFDMFEDDLRASLSIPSFHDHFDVSTGRLTDPDLDTRLREALATLSATALDTADIEETQAA